MIQELTLLIFRAANIRFGVWADHVEEMREAPGERPDDAADVLVYQGQPIAVIDLARHLARDRVRQESRLYSNTLRSPAAAEPADQAPSDMMAPKVLIMHSHQQSWIGVRIESPEALVTVPLRQIRALPELMRRTSRIKAFWGIALLHDDPVILVNPAQLLIKELS